MDVRQAINSEYAKTLDTTGLRKEFLVGQIFERDVLKLTYSHIDRIIVGGVWPVERAVEVPGSLGKAIGVRPQKAACSVSRGCLRTNGPLSAST
jgi:4-deoxy-L-threo-5-hexosulose-uronate ketol-isomerase